MTNIWDKVFKNGPSEICGRQPLINLKCYGLHKQKIPETRKMFAILLLEPIDNYYV